MTDAQQALPTYAQLETLARELAKTANNQSECWARIFHQVGVSAPISWAVRCIWLVEAISRLSPVTIDHERRGWPITNQEAYIEGFTGTKMSAEACIGLASVCYQLEQALGSDHVAIQPIRWNRKGALQRTHILSLTKVEEGKWTQ